MKAGHRDPVRNRDVYLSAAEHLAVQCSEGKFPISLPEIAKRRGIRLVEFRPLPVDGLLAFSHGGFCVFLNARDTNMAKKLADTWADEPRRTLPARARFTLAHEIAHTYLFEIKDGKPISKTEASLDDIEPFCNAVAASLLMPKSILRGIAANWDLLEPSILRRICEVAVVSPEALIYRLSPVHDWINESIAVACISDNGSGFKVDHIVAHARITRSYPELKKGFSCSKLVPDKKFVWNGGTETTAKRMFVLDGTKTKEEWTIRCEAMLGRNRFARYLVSILRP